MRGERGLAGWCCHDAMSVNMEMEWSKAFKGFERVKANENGSETVKMN